MAQNQEKRDGYSERAEGCREYQAKMMEGELFPYGLLDDCAAVSVCSQPAFNSYSLVSCSSLSAAQVTFRFPSSRTTFVNDPTRKLESPGSALGNIREAMLR